MQHSRTFAILLLALVPLLCHVAGQDDDPTPHVTTLTADNFDDVVLDPKKSVLVAFVASWCGHCKRLKPAYDKLAQAFQGSDEVVVAMIDADEHRKVGEKYDVSGFPTIKWFPKGEGKKPEDYAAGRSAKELITWINDKAGTDASEDAIVDKTAGVISSLTDTVKRYVNAEGEEQKTLMETIKEMGSSLDASARDNYQYYEKVMSKYATDGADYVSKEKNRIMNMLQNQKDNLKPKQKKSFMQRLNVLNIFSKDEL